MRALAKCPKCRKNLDTNCKGCIESGTSFHNCKSKSEVINVKWNLYPETEQEIEEVRHEH